MTTALIVTVCCLAFVAGCYYEHLRAVRMRRAQARRESMRRHPAGRQIRGSCHDR